MKKTLYALLALALPFASSAQDKETKDNSKLFGGTGHFSIAAFPANMNTLNSTLTTNGYKAINTISMGFGGGGFFCFHNILLGGEGYNIRFANMATATNTLKMEGGYGTLDVGYVFTSGKKSLLYPIAGIGMGGYNIVVAKKSVTSTFTSELNNPSSMATFDADGAVFSVRLGYKHFFGGSGRTGYCMGIQAGYVMTGSWDLKCNGIKLANSPSASMNSAIIGLTIGGGGFSK